jgi:DNA repair exonuclease SbcCD ATPase subunit
MNFAAVRQADIEFGPGLNVLYGPNDLGKPTLVEAIRLALLLPHSSTSCEQYVGWTGGREPIVELTFETESQRIWRVRKEFGKNGSSLLQESKNGRDFDDVERARKVDGKLREILRWGIPEPGGSGGGKGLPTSFLATALLSTQADVTALLDDSLANDPTASGKEQIAAALQAIAQDPLFVALLKTTQARRDEAYTDKGAKKTAKGSVFKAVAERVRETRDEKERLQKVVTDSEGAEKLLRDLTERRNQRHETLVIATERAVGLERFARQAEDCAAAKELVHLAQEEVQRIRKIGMDVEDAQRRAKELLAKAEEARQAIAALATAQATLAAAIIEKQSVAGESESLESTIAARNKLIEDAVRGARTKAEIARAAVEAAQEKLTAAIASHAQHGGRLVELLRLRDAEDLSVAETRLRDATERHAALPVPDRDVTKDEVNAAKKTEASVRLELDAIERELQRAHGALEQVGGAVARERLRDATEAFEVAERQERDIEADYEAWKLLLDQMKQADAAQASNLGQALAPAIAGRFQVLTQRRYDAVQLSAQLGTEGVVVGGTARPASRLSVGTREQLSTLYRLSLAEYLQTTLVLDDQLVQSDDSRMDWFRALLNEKAHIFQIIVFTCRPGDYLAATSMVPNGPRIHEDTGNGFVRAIDLGRALGQHRQSVT